MQLDSGVSTLQGIFCLSVVLWNTLIDVVHTSDNDKDHIADDAEPDNDDPRKEEK